MIKATDQNSKHPFWHRVLRRIRMILIALLILFFMALLAGFAYQRIAGHFAARKYPPPGQMVNVGSHRLHVVRMGRGSPTIVFDSPMGASHLAWSLVQFDVARFTETCTYDRAGYGWSEPGPQPRTSSRTVEELHTLLKNTGLKPPYILVGNSIGGLNVRMFAFRYPGEVAGLILVDPAHEDQFARMPLSARPDQSFIRLLRLSRIGSRFGLLRLLNMPLGEGSSELLPAKFKPMARAAGFRSAWIDALYHETIGSEASFAEVRSARKALKGRPLADIPLVVLTRGAAEEDTPDERKIWQTWLELHRELAGESSRGYQEIVSGSGHFIQADRPEDVIKAIRKLWEMANSNKAG